MKCKGKGKAIPLQAWTDPEGSRRLKADSHIECCAHAVPCHAVPLRV